MEWCKHNRHYLKHASREQYRRMGLASARVRELQRLNSEPPLYHPIGHPFCGMIYSLNLQYDRPVEQTILLFNFDSDRRDSYRAIVNNAEYSDRGGWHDWHQLNATAMQQRFINNFV